MKICNEIFPTPRGGEVPLAFLKTAGSELYEWGPPLYTGGLDKKNSLLVGFGMLGRAEFAFVVMDIAYIQHKILSIEAFYTLMFTAFWLNLMVPISIKIWKSKFGEAVP